MTATLQTVKKRIGDIGACCGGVNWLRHELRLAAHELTSAGAEVMIRRCAA